MEQFNRDVPVIIESESRSSSVTITITDTETDHYPSAQLSVEIADGDFQGRYSLVWTTDTDLFTFIRDFADVERTRAGKACLGSMSPDEFKLVIEYMNATDLLLTYSLQKVSYMGGHTVFHSVAGGYMLDASRLRQYVADFEALVRLPSETQVHDGGPT